jgi:hypothetical protein
MDTAAPNRVSVSVDFTFWQLFTAALGMIRYQPAILLLCSITPLSGMTLIILWCAKGFPDGAFPLVLGVFGICLVPFSAACKTFSLRRMKLMQGPFTYSFDSEGVHTIGNTFTQSVKWTAISRARESNQFLFLFISRSKAVCIPVKALRDQGIIEPVRSIVRQHSDFR